MNSALIPMRRWWLLLPVAIAMALPIWQAQLQYGWLDLALGKHSVAFWCAAGTWLALTIAGVWRHRAWWLLITAPVVLYPIVLAFGVVEACARGDCF